MANAATGRQSNNSKYFADTNLAVAATSRSRHRILGSYSRPNKANDQAQAEKGQAAVDLMVGRMRRIVEAMAQAAQDEARATAEADRNYRQAFLLGNYDKLRRLARSNWQQLQQQRERKAKEETEIKPQPGIKAPPPQLPRPPTVQVAPCRPRNNKLQLSVSSFEARRLAARRQLELAKAASVAAAAAAARQRCPAEPHDDKLLYELGSQSAANPSP